MRNSRVPSVERTHREDELVRGVAEQKDYVGGGLRREGEDDRARSAGGEREREGGRAAGAELGLREGDGPRAGVAHGATEIRPAAEADEGARERELDASAACASSRDVDEEVL